MTMATKISNFDNSQSLFCGVVFYLFTIMCMCIDMSLTKPLGNDHWY
jgi:hypothetical protein